MTNLRRCSSSKKPSGAVLLQGTPIAVVLCKPGLSPGSSPINPEWPGTHYDRQAQFMEIPASASRVLGLKVLPEETDVTMKNEEAVSRGLKSSRTGMLIQFKPSRYKTTPKGWKYHFV